MTSVSLQGTPARVARGHVLGAWADGLRRRLITRRQVTEFDRAMQNAGPTMQNELLAVREREAQHRGGC